MFSEITNPDFINAPYEFWVGSDVPVGTSVGQVRIVSESPSIDYDLLHTYQEGGTYGFKTIMIIFYFMVETLSTVCCGRKNWHYISSRDHHKLRPN